MGGTTFADSFTAEGTTGWADFNTVYNSQKGFEVELVSANAQDSNVTLVITTTTDFIDKNNLTAVRVVLSDGSSIDIPLSELESVNKGSYIENSVLLSKVDITRNQIKSVNVDYEPKNYDTGAGEEQQPTVSFDDAEQKVINKYRESMTSVGVLNNGERQIDTSFMIEKKAWLDFINDVNKADNYVTIEEGNEKGEYHVYTDVGEEKKLIEVIFIDFFESDSKGWVPGITPGTGQALAVGGIVIGTAAVVGLLVNNKRKKDEE